MLVHWPISIVRETIVLMKPFVLIFKINRAVTRMNYHVNLKVIVYSAMFGEVVLRERIVYLYQ